MDGFDREGGAAYSRLDILVNKAGISGSSVGDPDGLAGWDRIIAVGFSVKAALNSSEAGNTAADQEFPPRSCGWRHRKRGTARHSQCPALAWPSGN
jgi:NAD(P)-dependent dehydrogenase (short-subunit alcohol dehydrogenase family)